MRHLTRARTEHPPGQKAAEDGVADAGPHSGDAVFPTELAGIADEHHGGEVAGAVRECAHPRADVAPTQNETVDARGSAAAVQADANRHADENQNHADFCDHDRSFTDRYRVDRGIFPIRKAAAPRQGHGWASERIRIAQPGNAHGTSPSSLRTYATSNGRTQRLSPVCYRYR